MIASKPEVQELSFLVNGQRQKGRPGSLHPVTNPATGEVIAEVPCADASEIGKKSVEYWLVGTSPEKSQV
jgi:hypothetical protein